MFSSSRHVAKRQEHTRRLNRSLYGQSHTAANNSSRGWYGIDPSAELRLRQSLQFLVGNSEDGTPSQPQASYQRNTGRPPTGGLLMCKSRCLWMPAGVQSPVVIGMTKCPS